MLKHLDLGEHPYEENILFKIWPSLVPYPYWEMANAVSEKSGC